MKINSLRQVSSIYKPIGTMPTIGSFTANITGGDFALRRKMNNGSSTIELSCDPLGFNYESSLVHTDAVKAPFNVDVPLSISQRSRHQFFGLQLVDSNYNNPAFSIQDPSITLASISQTTTTLTVVLSTPTTLERGDQFSITGLADNRFNYQNASINTLSLDKKTITVTIADDIAISSLTVTPVATSGMFVPNARKSYNNFGYKFTGSAQTTAVARSRGIGSSTRNSGSISTSAPITIGTTAPVINNGGNGQIEVKATNAFEFEFDRNFARFMDYGIDNANGVSTVRQIYDQSLPNSNVNYYPMIRSTLTLNPSRPVAKIISAVKATASTTTTITTASAHGLQTGAFVEIQGIRDQTNFPATTGVTATVIDATTFTVPIAGTTIATSYGGAVIQRSGQQQFVGFSSQAIQSASIDADGILTVIGSASWTIIQVGEYINIYGMRADLTGADLGLDGAYELIDVSTTTAKLRAIKDADGAQVLGGNGLAVTPTLSVMASANCGGSMIMRSTIRANDLKLEQYSYDVTKVWGQGESAIDKSVPVNIISSIAQTQNPMTQSQGSGSISYKLIGGASTNANVIKSTAGNLSSLLICNDSAAKIYFKLYNKATAPTVGTDIPLMVVPVAAGANQYVDVGTFYGIYLSAGISFATTALAADADATVVTAGVIVNAVYK